MNEQTIRAIESGHVFLGIELGSTRIKSVLIGEDHTAIASGSFDWENKWADGLWTYALEDVWKGLQAAFRSLADEVQNRYGVPLRTASAIGVSAMMHGYLVFDKDDNQLVPFRTWRNTTTEQAAALLSEKFQFNVPLRWNAAHLYQAVLNQEPHVQHIDFLTTLSGYVHWKLTGQKVLGVGDASGMFPIDSRTSTYHAGMARTLNELLAEAQL
jgi:sugar (pentulose or hexulose) kinase